MVATLASLWQNREKPFTSMATITTAAATAVWNSQDSSPPVPTTQLTSFCWRFYSFLSFTLGFTPGTLLQLRMTSGFWHSCLHLLRATVTNVYNHTLLLCGTGDGTKDLVCTRQTLHQLSDIPSFPDVLFGLLQGSIIWLSFWFSLLCLLGRGKANEPRGTKMCRKKKQGSLNAASALSWTIQLLFCNLS